MIGRSASNEIIKSTIIVAEVVFDLLKNETTMLDVYDYTEDLSGHTSVNIILEDTPYNVLKKPMSPILIIQN